MLEFDDGEDYKTITVTVYDDVETEEDEVFYIDLSLIEIGATKKELSKDANATCEVTIIDDDEPGELSFEPPAKETMAMPVTSASETAGKARVKVGRYNGSNGRVQCDYEIMPDTALPGTHYAGEAKGTLVFDNTEVEKWVEVPLINTMKTDGEHAFFVNLVNFKADAARAKFGKFQKLKVVLAAAGVRETLFGGAFRDSTWSRRAEIARGLEEPTF